MLSLNQNTSKPKAIRPGIIYERVANIRPTLWILSFAATIIWLCLLPKVWGEDDQLRYQRFMAEQNRYGKPRPRTVDRESGYAAEHMIRNNLWFVDELKSPPYRGVDDPNLYRRHFQTSQTVNKMVPIPKISQSQAEINSAYKAAEMTRKLNRFSRTPQDIQGFRQARRNYLNRQR
jgi:hypothetical protein